MLADILRGLIEAITDAEDIAHTVKRGAFRF